MEINEYFIFIEPKYVNTKLIFLNMMRNIYLLVLNQLWRFKKCIRVILTVKTYNL